MSVWYKSYSLDGVYYQNLFEEPFKTCDSPEEVKEALEHWAVEFNHVGDKFAICKQTYDKYYDEQGNFTKIVDVLEVVEHYTIGGKYVQDAKP